MSRLHDAARRGDAAVVDDLLYNDSNISARDENNNTPLWIAAREGHLDTVHAIVAHCPTSGDGKYKVVNATCENNHTALSIAASFGHVDVVRLLLKQRVEVNTITKDGYTPLTLAAEKGYEAVASLLLGANDINLGPDGRGKTPLDTAVECRHLNIAGSLMEAERRRSPTVYPGQTLLSWAIASDRKDVVRLLNDPYFTSNGPNLPGRDGYTPLSNAAARGNLGMVGLLLENSSIDVNAPNEDGSTALSLAAKSLQADVVRLLARKDNVTLHSLIREGDLETVEFLLAGEIDFNKTDLQGQAALHIAVTSNQLQIAEELLSRGADPDAEDESGKTPFLLAVQHNQKDFIDLFLSKSARAKGVTARDWQTIYRSNRSSPETILRVSERANGGVEVRFVDQSNALEDESEIVRSLLQFSSFEDCLSALLRLGLNPMLGLDRPRARKAFYNFTEVVGQGTWVFLTTLIPNGDTIMEQTRSEHWDVCCIAWTVGGVSEGGSPVAKRTKDHYSMLPDGWIPDTGIEFFQRFMVHLTERWSYLRHMVEEHLSFRRMEQFEAKGHSNMVMHLAKDSQTLAGLLASIRGQVRGARKFVVIHGHVLGAGSERRALEAIESFADIEDQLKALDQTIRDLLQLEFAWVSINEAHRSTTLGISMQRLSWITFIFLPAMYTSSLFGMNVDILEGNPDWRWYLLFLGVMQILTISGWLLFKYYANMSASRQAVGARKTELEGSQEPRLGTFPEM